MNEKIENFIKIYVELLGLDINSKNGSWYYRTLTHMIKARADRYKNITIPSNFDDQENYIIKPNTNGTYNIEDFLMNRLFQSMRSIDDKTINDEEMGEFDGIYRKLKLNYDHLFNINFEEYKNDNKAKFHTTKTLVHETGHAMQTTYTGNYKHSKVIGTQAQDDMYVQLVDRLKKLQNGKYANIIKSIDEMSQSKETCKMRNTMGIRTKNLHCTELDEMMNELETLEIMGANIEGQFRRFYAPGTRKYSNYYINVCNLSSGYQKYSGIAKQLRILIGKDNLFHLQYGDTQKVIDKLNKIYGNNFFNTLVAGINNIVINDSQRNAEDYIKVDTFLAQKIANKVDVTLQNGCNEETLKRMQSCVETALLYSTHNYDKNIDMNLPHIQIYNDAIEKIMNHGKQISYLVK